MLNNLIDNFLGYLIIIVILFYFPLYTFLLENKNLKSIFKINNLPYFLYIICLFFIFNYNIFIYFCIVFLGVIIFNNLRFNSPIFGNLYLLILLFCSLFLENIEIDLVYIYLLTFINLLYGSYAIVRNFVGTVLYIIKLLKNDKKEI